MGRASARLPGFCLNRIRPQVRVRPPPPLQAKREDNSAHVNEQEVENKGNAVDERSSEMVKAVGRKVMIVVNSSVEARGAIHWALSHTVQSQDTVVLLHVIRPTQQGLFYGSFLSTIFYVRASVSTSFQFPVPRRGKPSYGCFEIEFSFAAATCDECSKERAPRANELVHAIKNACQLKKPEVNLIRE